VNPSELRTKARVRDVNLESNRSMMLADNSGRVYSKAERKSNSKSKLGGVGSRERPTTLASVQPAKTRASANRNPSPSRADRIPARQSQKEAVDSRQRTPSTNKNQNRQPLLSRTGNSTRQRSASQAKAPKRSSKPGIPVNSTRQQPRVAVAPVRQTRQATASKNTARVAPVRQTRQATASKNTARQASRSVSAPVQKQSRSPQASPPKSSRGGAPKYTASAPKARQTQASRSSQKRSGANSNSGGSRRDSRGRSGKN